MNTSEAEPVLYKNDRISLLNQALKRTNWLERHLKENNGQPMGTRLDVQKTPYIAGNEELMGLKRHVFELYTDLIDEAFKDDANKIVNQHKPQEAAIK